MNANKMPTAFVKDNYEYLSILARWCEEHNVSFSGKETSLILSVIDEILTWNEIDFTNENNPNTPSVDTPVIAKLRWPSGKELYSVIKFVDEDDVSWRTVDDESEI